MSANPHLLDEIMQRLRGVLPSGLGDVRQDVEKNMKMVLQGAFAKLDLVTREEFDVQSEVLARTREKLQLLEQQVGALEKVLKIEKNQAPDA